MPILLKSDYDLKLPQMRKAKQIFENNFIDDIENKVISEIYKDEIRSLIKPGMKIAVAVGSRGIKNIDKIIKTIVKCLKELGADPFIKSAMGSHGGGTSEGQNELLRSYNIREEVVGAPVITSLDVIKIGETQKGIPVYFDKAAYEADLIIPVNRIKPHTDFGGTFQSGLCKMLVIGLGNHKGCSTIHQEEWNEFSNIICEASEIIINHAKIGFGIGIVENAYENTAVLKSILAQDFHREEPKLLKYARRLMPKLLIPEIDVLIVERIGKDISGLGFDPNILGRNKTIKNSKFVPKIERMILLGLTEASHGNATGAGLFDFITQDVFKSIDFESTYANNIAAKSLEVAYIPLIMEDEKTSVLAAIKSSRRIDENNPRIVRIKDTLHLDTIEISENLVPIAEKIKNITLL